MMNDAPASTAASASAHSLEISLSRTPGDPSAGNVVSRVTASKPLYLRFLSRSSSLLVITGRLDLTTLQSLGAGSRMFCWTDPMYPVMDMTSSSLIGSMGGFVTCANCWRK